MIRRDPISRLANRCTFYGLRRKEREHLAEATFSLATTHAKRLVRLRRLRACDVDACAVDATAWCINTGVHLYNATRASWATFVRLAVVREAARIVSINRRQEGIMRDMGYNYRMEDDQE